MSKKVSNIKKNRLLSVCGLRGEKKMNKRMKFIVSMFVSISLVMGVGAQLPLMADAGDNLGFTDLDRIVEQKMDAKRREIQEETKREGLNQAYNGLNSMSDSFNRFIVEDDMEDRFRNSFNMASENEEAMRTYMTIKEQLKSQAKNIYLEAGKLKHEIEKFNKTYKTPFKKNWDDIRSKMKLDENGLPIVTLDVGKGKGKEKINYVGTDISKWNNELQAAIAGTSIPTPAASGGTAAPATVVTPSASNNTLPIDALMRAFNGGGIIQRPTEKASPTCPKDQGPSTGEKLLASLFPAVALGFTAWAGVDNSKFRKSNMRSTDRMMDRARASGESTIPYLQLRYMAGNSPIITESMAETINGSLEAATAIWLGPKYMSGDEFGKRSRSRSRDRELEMMMRYLSFQRSAKVDEKRIEEFEDRQTMAALRNMSKLFDINPFLDNLNNALGNVSSQFKRSESRNSAFRAELINAARRAEIMDGAIGKIIQDLDQVRATTSQAKQNWDNAVDQTNDGGGLKIRRTYESTRQSQSEGQFGRSGGTFPNR